MGGESKPLLHRWWGSSRALRRGTTWHGGGGHGPAQSADLAMWIKALAMLSLVAGVWVTCNAALNWGFRGDGWKDAAVEDVIEPTYRLHVPADFHGNSAAAAAAAALDIQSVTWRAVRFLSSDAVDVDLNVETWRDRSEVSSVAPAEHAWARDAIAAATPQDGRFWPPASRRVVAVSSLSQASLALAAMPAWAHAWGTLQTIWVLLDSDQTPELCCRDRNGTATATGPRPRPHNPSPASLSTCFVCLDRIPKPVPSPGARRPPSRAALAAAAIEIADVLVSIDGMYEGVAARLDTSVIVLHTAAAAAAASEGPGPSSASQEAGVPTGAAGSIDHWGRKARRRQKSKTTGGLGSDVPGKDADEEQGQVVTISYTRDDESSIDGANGDDGHQKDGDGGSGGRTIRHACFLSSMDAPPAVSPTKKLRLCAPGGAVVHKLLQDALHPPSRPDLTFHSYLSPTSGYGSSAEQMALALSRKGLRVRFLPLIVPYNTPPAWATMVDKATPALIYSWSHPSSLPPPDPACLASLDVPCGIATALAPTYVGYFVPHERDVALVHPHARKAKARWIYSTFETTRPPRRWTGLINQYDRLLVSAPQLKDIFVRAGVTVPVQVCALGVNTDVWQELGNRDWGTKPFTFLLAADGKWSGTRKNYEQAVRAFAAEFEGRDDVRLVVKVTETDEDVAAAKERSPANVEIYTGRLAFRRLLTLFFWAHCFLFPSHGEGYGLTPREAMATGIPPIIAPFAGMSALNDPEVAFPLKWEFATADPTQYGGWVVENENRTDFGEWASVTDAELRRVMRYAVEHPAEVRRRGLNAARWVRKHESYDITAEGIARIVGFVA